MNPTEASLYDAVKIGNIAEVKAALAAGVNPHNNDGECLREAAFRGYTEIMQIFLVAGSDVHAFGDAALRWAALRGHIDAVRLLLAAGGDPVTAWATSQRINRRALAAALEQCADAMTPDQRNALSKKSKMLTRLQAYTHSSQRHRHLCR